MAAGLGDLTVFNEYAYSAMTEVLRQQIDLFNTASNGAIALRSSAHQGDYSESVFYKLLSGLVRERDERDATPTAVSAIKLEHELDRTVKIARGTPPVEMPPSQWRWIQRNPAEAGAAMGQQLAVAMMADMLNTSIAGLVAALSTANQLDVTATSDTAMSAANLNSATALFGDRSGEISVWISHSKSLHDFYGLAIANATTLFTYGTINVMGDPFGRRFIVTDSSELITATTNYHCLGLVPGAAYIGQNNDFESNWDTSNGYENIQRSYQAEWSFQLGYKGFRYDTTGGANPAIAAIRTNTNWDQNVSDIKDTAGVDLVVL